MRSNMIRPTILRFALYISLLLLSFTFSSCHVVIGDGCFDFHGPTGVLHNGCPDPDTTSPAAVAEQAVQSRTDSITLNWTPSTSTDVKEIQITWVSADGTKSEEPIIISDVELTTLTVNGLSSSVGYTFYIKTIDTSDNESSVVEITATTLSEVAFDEEQYEFAIIATGSAGSNSIDPGGPVGTLPNPTKINPLDENPPTTEYRIIENSADDSTFFAIDSTTAQITVGSALNTAVKSYTFTVEATSSQGLSATTTVDIALQDAISPLPVSRISSAVTDNTITLGWFDSPSTDVEQIEITWAVTDTSVPLGRRIIQQGAQSAVISDLTPDTSYTFSITVIDDSNNKSTLETATAATPAAPVDANGNRLIDIHSLEQLHNMRYNLAGTSYKTSSMDPGARCGITGNITCNGYELTQSLSFDRDDDVSTYDLSGALDSDDHHDTYFPVTSTNTGGWLPIGDAPNPFSTTFEGNGFYIRGLAIRRNQTYIGMFGRTDSSAIIRNIRLTNNLADYTGTSSTYVGGLVAYNEGIIIASYAGGDADGGTGSIDYVGGLVGYNDRGTISASYATGDASGGNGLNDDVGGLVGQNRHGTISASYATGDASGGDGNSDDVGGLVGHNHGTIIASYATGDADAENGRNESSGGLVGWHQDGIIIASYATGSASGHGAWVASGGLVGWSQNASIIASYATGDTVGGVSDGTGGALLGRHAGTLTITSSYGFGTSTVRAYNGVDGSNDRPGNWRFDVGAGINGARAFIEPGTSWRAAPAVWNQEDSNTQDAWSFGAVDVDAPALRYADYDGADGDTYGCGSSSTATIVIPDRVPVSGGIPGGFIDVTCGDTLLGGPQPR